MTIPIHPLAFPYQQAGAEWLSTRRNACLFDDMGVGKSSQSIWAADIAGHRRILVLCPGIARINWGREFERWQTTPRTIGVVVDDKGQSDSIICDPSVPNTDVVICGYHNTLSRPVLEKLVGRRWDQIICDESHYLKNPLAVRTMVVFGRHCDGAAGLVGKTGGVWLLSGTPFPNGPHEAWTWCHALFPELTRDLPSYAAWENRFCVTEQGMWNTRLVELQNLRDFVQRLRPHVLRRLLNDVQPELPPARFGHVVVDPSVLPPFEGEQSEEVSAVIEAARMKLASTEDNFSDGDAGDAQSWVQSMQLASLRRWTGIAKAPAVADMLLEDLKNGLSKLVVFAVHREVIQILSRAIPDALVIHGGVPHGQRQFLIDQFQGRVPGRNPRVLICNIEIASTNLTLTASADIAFAETTWVPKDVLQGVHRCRRIGQTRPVLARIFSLRGSLDEAVGSVLARRSNLVSRLETEFSR